MLPVDRRTMDMGCRIDQSTAFFSVHEHGCRLGGFSPAMQHHDVIGGQLTVKEMVKSSFFFQCSIVNMDRGEEDSIRVGAGKFESQGMDFLVALAKLENHEAVVAIAGHRLPGVFGQTKTFIQPGEIYRGGYEGSVKTPYPNDGQFVQRFRALPTVRGCAANWWLGESSFQVAEEIGVMLEVDKANCIFASTAFGWDWQDHGNVMGRLQSQAVNDLLGFTWKSTDKNLGVMNRLNRT